MFTVSQTRFHCGYTVCGASFRDGGIVCVLSTFAAVDRVVKLMVGQHAQSSSRLWIVRISVYALQCLRFISAIDRIVKLPV